ncbi:ABC transporter ATP-binding protein [Absicoccus intestinalis]|uniref:Putative hemin import ATP-binding protein HrtA n=1 Tax=Absicoccus intestinalis TaxID=2926319 RepID=A0ABU4WLY7_9FIRM|nr:ABC transporter ATP-binding protein [Absicoccus sp. CLA-KB-P134]MDX8417577.1 ABC transporter ATP-binding protein [Absicoccus sp. CLA-KB-P134]
MQNQKQSTILEISHVSMSYQDGQKKRQILQDVNVSIHAGEFVAIVGPSGCGKSTFLNIAGMMLSGDTGKVILRGEDLSMKKKQDWTAIRRDHIGFIFQNHQLLPFLTAREQLDVVKKANPEKVEQLAQELDLTKIMDHYPSQMSGGERQRVALARAFITDPDVILADEPTASLDSQRGRQAVKMIAMEVHKRNKAAIMVTHDSRVLDLVDIVYQMEDGKLKQVG